MRVLGLLVADAETLAGNYDGRLLTCTTSEIKDSTRKMTKRTSAIQLAVPAIWPNPRTAATIATMRKTNA
jgi:hypothetical protein